MRERTFLIEIKIVEGGDSASVIEFLSGTGFRFPEYELDTGHWILALTVPVSLVAPLSELPDVAHIAEFILGKVLGSSRLPTVTPTPAPAGPTIAQSPIPPNPPCSYPKLSGELEGVVCAYERQMPADPPRTVGVQVYPHGDTATIIEYLEANGAIDGMQGVDLFAAFQYKDWGHQVAVSFIPLTLLGPLSQLPAVRFIEHAPRPIPG